MGKPVAVYGGFIGKLPMAGMALANLHVICGLQSLGYDVHYVERQNDRENCYDPQSNTMTDDPACALNYLEALLPKYGIFRERYSFIDLENNCYGSGWNSLDRVLNHADFVLTMGDPTWFDELERCPRRAFIDTDPVFTQVAMETGTERPGSKASAIAHYGVLFTEGLRFGKADCTIPCANRTWIPAGPAIATKLWKPAVPRINLPITTLMNWASGSEIVHGGRTYGYKGREFERFIELPRRTTHSFSIAVGGSAPRERLNRYGWHLVGPLAVTATIEAYQQFIADSWADFGIAKHAYVVSRSGWFSDRSTCYLASGRPVLHQDTGCGDWLPTGEGLLLFSNLEEVLKGLEELNGDYERHARAARKIAEEYFEAETVLGRMLDQAGFR